MFFSRIHKGLLTLSAVITLLPVGSQAAIVGNLNFGGNVVASGANNGSLLFQANASGPGTFNINSSTGSFAGLSGGTRTDLNINGTADPINTIINVPNFLTFTGVPNLSFTLTQVVGGTYGTANCFVAAAAGQTCSPPGTPYNLTNLTANTSSIVLTVYGFFVNTTTGESNAGTGVFTVSNSAGSYQNLLNTIGSGGTATLSYGAQFTATAPEPSTTVLTAFLGLGLVIAGTTFQKKMRRS